MYARLPSKLTLYSFKILAPHIVLVGSASATVRGYIDVSLKLSNVEIAHPLLVVKNLSCPLLISTDIFCPHAVNISLGDATSLQLTARVCDVCLK